MTTTVTKRFIDVCVALAALVVLVPLFAIIAVAIKLDSRGPVFFRQERMGRGMRRFRVFKFRTMVYAPVSTAGPLLTVDGDGRITRVGALLRKSKLDEFPQFLNVLIGQMSLVGPRPEVPKYVELFAKDYEIILGVRPGLTDPASFKYRHEGAILGRAQDPEKEYIERILPDKIKLAKSYVADSSLSLDLTLLVKTLLEAVGMEATPAVRAIIRHRRPLVIAIHLVLVVAAYYLAWFLRFDGSIPAYETQLFWQFLPWLLVIRASLFAMFRLYQGLWRYTSLEDGISIAAAVLLSIAPFVLVVRAFYGEAAHPRSVFVIDAVLLVALMSGVRLVRRAYHELAAGGEGIKVLVFGAADLGELMIRELKKSERYRVIGLLDDNSEKRGRRIHGVSVLGGRTELPRILAEQKPSEVLIAIANPDPPLLRDLLRLVYPFNVKLTMFPTVSQSLGKRVELSEVRSVRVEDLLTRPVVRVDEGALARLISGRRVMVTGAGGSIGSELSRQIASLGPESLVLFDRYENSLHAIRIELDRRMKSGLSAIMGDVTDIRRVNEVMQRFRPEIVFHAAAHKHVPLMEDNQCEAVKNNIGGTRILAQAAEIHAVDRFILISTDKAVNPTSVMGATKRVAELLVQSLAPGSGTSFSTVRFGNVLGSNGSVVPLFLDQIRAGGPVTITHPEMRRFFMLIPEAVHLVLHAAAHADNGATYVLEMGEQVKLVDMARNLIRLSGFVPDEDVKIQFIGLRPGEKLSEEILGAHENAEPSGVEKIQCVTSSVPPPLDLIDKVATLERQAAAGDARAVVASLQSLVLEFCDALQPARVIAETRAEPAGESTSVAVSPPELTELICLKCQSANVFRSRPRSLVERIKKEFTAQRIFRCEDCGWRGWALPLEFGSHESVDPSPAPDLGSVDAVTDPEPAPSRPAFSPRDLR